MKEIKAKIHYVDGDATRPTGDGNKIIAHIVNDMGKWGKGFVLALSERWPHVEQDYRDWHAGKHRVPFWPGTVRLVNAEGNSDKFVYVAHMLAQSGVRSLNSNETLLQYGQLRNCLGILAEYALTLGATVHMPMIGAGLAGGDWEKIEPIILEELADKGVHTVVYVFNKEDWEKVSQ
jgi:O-acetyl-ADP-ribose deacetylase (regulator of RNase III)